MVGGGDLDLPALSVNFPSVTSSLLPKLREGGGGGLSCVYLRIYNAVKVVSSKLL